MPDTYLAPYLNFNGNCREAMEFYHGVMGGELELHTFDEYDMPNTPEDYKTKIMHSMIKNDSLTFMASDSPPGMDYKVGNHISLSLAGTDAEMLRKFWDGLSQGGQVTMPMEKQVWGDEFGMFTDKFGMSWMVNITQPTGA